MIIGDTRSLNIVIEKVKMAMKDDNTEIRYIFDAAEEDAIFKRIDGMDEVFMCADVAGDLKMKVISYCMGKKQVIYVIPQLFEISLLNSKLTQFDDVPAFMIGTLDLSIEQKFFKRFCKDMPEYNHRYVVRAGITGFAQVLGSYDTSPEDKLRYDLMYIKNYSLLLDIKLILQTLKVVFMGDKVHEKSFYRDSRLHYLFNDFSRKGRSLKL